MCYSSALLFDGVSDMQDGCSEFPQPELAEKDFIPQASARQPFLLKVHTAFLRLFFPHIQILGMQQMISVMQNSVEYRYDLGVYNNL